MIQVCDACKQVTDKVTLIKETFVYCDECCEQYRSGSGRIDLKKFSLTKPKPPPEG